MFKVIGLSFFVFLLLQVVEARAEDKVIRVTGSAPLVFEHPSEHVIVHSDDKVNADKVRYSTPAISDQPLLNKERGTNSNLSNSYLTTPSIKFPLLILVEEQGLTLNKTKAIVENKLNIIAQMAVSTGSLEQSIQHFDLVIKPIILPQENNFTIDGLLLDTPNHSINKPQAKTSKPNHNHHNNQLNDKVFIASTNTQQQTNKSGFLISGELSVELVDEQAYYNFIDQLIKLNVKDIKVLREPLNQVHAAYKKAVAQALINANKKALNIAEQLGGQLGAIISFDEVTKSPLLSADKQRISNQIFDLNDARNQENEMANAQVIVTFSFERE